MQKPHWEAPVATKASVERFEDFGFEPGQARDRPPCDPGGRGHTRDPGMTVDEHGAASALALRRAAVLDRGDADALAQYREQRLVVVDLDLDLVAVEGELERAQLNDWPQPQLRCAFGLFTWKPEPWSPSW